MRNKDLRAYIAQRMSNSVVTRHFSCSAEECDDHRKTDSPINEVMEAIEVRLAEARNAALDDLLEAMPEKRKLVEPVTKRPVLDIGDKVGIDLDADTKGSLVFIQDNGFNQALTQVTATIHQLKSSKEGADDE